MKDLIFQKVKQKDPTHRISLTIYHESPKTSQLLLRNHSAVTSPPLQRDHVIYQHSCSHEDCGPHSYIGMTRTRLSRRLTCHLQAGAIKNHYRTHHNIALNRQHLEDGTTILDKETDHRRLLLLEALYIAEKRPTMNAQVEDFQILPTSKRPPTHHVNHLPPRQTNDQ